MSAELAKSTLDIREIGTDYKYGFHDKEDPGILSLAFHWPSKTVFSGGIDRTVSLFPLSLGFYA